MIRRQRDERGQAIVEFALIVSIFVLVLMGIFDFGRAIFAFNTINQAAREGARLAIVDQTVAHIQNEAIQTGVSLDLTVTDVIVDFRGRFTPDTAGSCTGAVAGDDNNSASIVDCFAVVRVQYDYVAATPIIGAIVGPIQMEGESRFQVDFNCEGPECPMGES